MLLSRAGGAHRHMVGYPGLSNWGKEDGHVFFMDSCFHPISCHVEAGVAGSSAFEAAQQESNSSKMMIRFNLFK